MFNRANYIKKLPDYYNIVFWGAGRIFDGLIKIGNISPKKNMYLVDRNLYKYFKKLHGFKVRSPKNLQLNKENSILIVCSREYKRSIVDDAKKFSFSKVIYIT